MTRSGLLQAFGGADTLYGNAGDDQLLGQKGNDTIRGGPGNDDARGGAGNDTIRVRGDGATDEVSCQNGVDVVYHDSNDIVADDCETRITVAGA